MKYNFQISLAENILFRVTLCLLIMLLVGAAYAGNSTQLPRVLLTDAAVGQAKVMLNAENDSRAILSLIKGNFEVSDKSDHVKEKHSGWMLQIVNREQFPDEPRQKIKGLEILFPQRQLYSELEGATLDFKDDWWVLNAPK